MGRVGEILLRLPTVGEVQSMGIQWTERRTNRIQFGNETHEVIYALPEIEWPEKMVLEGQIDFRWMRPSLGKRMRVQEHASCGRQSHSCQLKS